MEVFLLQGTSGAQQAGGGGVWLYRVLPAPHGSPPDPAPRDQQGSSLGPAGTAPGAGGQLGEEVTGTPLHMPACPWAAAGGTDSAQPSRGLAAPLGLCRSFCFAASDQSPSFTSPLPQLQRLLKKNYDLE